MPRRETGQMLGKSLAEQQNEGVLESFGADQALAHSPWHTPIMRILKLDFRSSWRAKDEFIRADTLIQLSGRQVGPIRAFAFDCISDSLGLSGHSKQARFGVR